MNVDIVFQNVSEVEIIKSYVKWKETKPCLEFSFQILLQYSRKWLYRRFLGTCQQITRLLPLFYNTQQYLLAAQLLVYLQPTMISFTLNGLYEEPNNTKTHKVTRLFSRNFTAVPRGEGECWVYNLIISVGEVNGRDVIIRLQFLLNWFVLSLDFFLYVIHYWVISISLSYTLVGYIY